MVRPLSWVEEDSSLSIIKGVIPQFGFLFKGSLRDNLEPFNIKPERAMRRVMEKTGFKLRDQSSESKEENLGATESVLDCSNHLDLEIQKSGANLSNGEKQMINFLRVLLKDVSVICLDEATSNMDPRTGCIDSASLDIIERMLCCFK